MRRYAQSRDRSAELLRLVVPQMARSEAACNPESFAVWYEHLAGINRPLSAALGERIANDQPLTDKDVASLFRTHVAERDLQAAEQLQHELLRLMEHVGEVALGAGDGMAEYGAALASCVAQLRSDPSPEALHGIVDLLAAHTEQARGRTEKLRADLQSFRGEMQSLRTEVDTLREEAMTDALTGLFNRRGFERAVEEFAVRPAGIEGASLLLCDVDNFKNVNDAYGHLVGDRVLAAIGRVLKARVKGRDSVARWGGEEFSVFLPETAAGDARGLAEQIRGDVARGRIKRIDRDEYVGSITISIGVAEAMRGESLEALLDRADTALYEAKAGGRNRTVLADRTPAGRPRAVSAAAG